jgi:peptidoglycan/LPS O-acetylase OafA/YrhL
MKGIAILWIVFFHFFLAYNSHSGRYPWPLNLAALPSYIAGCVPVSVFQAVCHVSEGCCVALFQRGAQAVGVFLVLSGFGLTYGLAGKGSPAGGWGSWYVRRLVRLFPVYWLAHLVYLVSPFVHRQDPIDYRLIFSLLGNRVYPVETMFYYMSPSWWFFGLLLQLYLVFPLLCGLLEKLGPWKYLVLCGTVTVLSRYLFFGILQANGNYVQGAFFGCRLWEFGAGMVLARAYIRDAETVEARLFSLSALAFGLAIYVLGVFSYRPSFTYSFTDMLIGTGLFIVVANLARATRFLPRAGSVLAVIGVYSYGIYLFHHPYVITFGERLRDFELPVFVITACAVTAAISVAAIPLEYYTNRMTGWVFSIVARTQPAPVPAVELKLPPARDVEQDRR